MEERGKERTGSRGRKGRDECEERSPASAHSSYGFTLPHKSVPCIVFELKEKEKKPGKSEGFRIFAL